MSELFDVLKEVVVFSREAEKDWTVVDALDKLQEESGELYSAKLILSGKIKHKSLDEPICGEIADNVIALSHSLSYLLDDFNIDDVSNLFEIKTDYKSESLDSLFQKYKSWTFYFQVSLVEFLSLSEENKDLDTFKDNVLSYLECISILYYLNLNYSEEKDASLSSCELVLKIKQKLDKWKNIIENYD